MKILFIGDACLHSGFATVTHSILHYLHQRHEVHVCGVNYRGDPHGYPYPIYRADMYGDTWGVRRFDELCAKIQPDIVCINNDPWNVVRFLTDYRPVPIVAYMPIDGDGLPKKTASLLNQLTCAIWYTEYGKKVAEKSGFAGKSEIVPHGVDSKRFRPIEKMEARRTIGLPQEGFLIGNVNRNQLRKRLDLSIKAFSIAYHEYGLKDAWLYLHSAMRDEGGDLQQIAEYYGVADRVMSPAGKDSFQGVDYDAMPYIYSSLDMQISTSMGEGWGLTTMEGMACGVPQVIPYHSALAEWPSGEVDYVCAPDDFVMPYGVNLVCKVPSARKMAEWIAQYHNGNQGNKRHNPRQLVTQPQYKWESIANRFESIFQESIDAVNVAIGKETALQTVS